jgi:class 3 adenylate cyclase
MGARGKRRAPLLTDVVGSTEFAAPVGDEAMAKLWAAHGRVARNLLAHHGGREIDGMLLRRIWLGQTAAREGRGDPASS